MTRRGSLARCIEKALVRPDLIHRARSLRERGRLLGLIQDRSPSRFLARLPALLARHDVRVHGLLGLPSSTLLGIAYRPEALMAMQRLALFEGGPYWDGLLDRCHEDAATSADDSFRPPIVWSPISRVAAPSRFSLSPRAISSTAARPRRLTCRTLPDVCASGRVVLAKNAILAKGGPSLGSAWHVLEMSWRVAKDPTRVRLFAFCEDGANSARDFDLLLAEGRLWEAAAVTSKEPRASAECADRIWARGGELIAEMRNALQTRPPRCSPDTDVAVARLAELLLRDRMKLLALRVLGAP